MIIYIHNCIWVLVASMVAYLHIEWLHRISSFRWHPCYLNIHHCIAMCNISESAKRNYIIPEMEWCAMVRYPLSPARPIWTSTLLSGAVILLTVISSPPDQSCTRASRLNRRPSYHHSDRSRLSLVMLPPPRVPPIVTLFVFPSQYITRRVRVTGLGRSNQRE